MKPRTLKKKIIVAAAVVFFNVSLAYAAGNICTYFPLPGNSMLSGRNISLSQAADSNAGNKLRIIRYKPGLPSLFSDNFSWKKMKILLEKEKAFRTAI